MNASHDGDKPYIASMPGFLNANMRSGRYSAGLVADLEAHLANRTANVFAILREIGIMEGAVQRRSTTKAATMFTGPWLQGLWHKHHTQAAFLARNTKLEWPTKRLAAVIQDLRSRATTVDPWALAGKIAHRVVVDGLQERASSGRMTGQWIVFAQQNGVSTYLTLGDHGDDAAIWQRCRACAAEFPDLAILQETRSG